MFEIKNLTVAYQGDLILDHLSINFPLGKLTGIIGPNGAGKSTMIKGALGLIKSQSGQTFCNGIPLNKVKNKIAYVEQRAVLDLSFPISVLEVILTGSYPKLGMFSTPSVREKKATLEALNKVDLVPLKDHQIGQLSGGQLQRVFIARAIVQDADVVILDEPFVGIDMVSEQKIMAILKEWCRMGKTVIVVHHDLNKVSEYFDELVMLNRKLIVQGPVDETYQLANIQKTYSQDFGELLFQKNE